MEAAPYDGQLTMLHQTNTARKITRVLQVSPYATPADIVRELWPGTRQFQKKARTVVKYIRALDREAKVADRPRNGREYQRFPRLAR